MSMLLLLSEEHGTEEQENVSRLFALTAANLEDE